MPEHDDPNFDPTISQRTREPVSSKNHDLLINMSQRLELLEDQYADMKGMLGQKFDDLNRTMRSSVIVLAQAPISITGILVATSLLYIEKLQTWEWMLCCAVMIYPLYGEGLMQIWGKIKGKQ